MFGKYSGLSNGLKQVDVPGTSGHVMLQLKIETGMWSNGCITRAVHGTKGRYVMLQLNMKTWKYFSGCIARAVRWAQIHAFGQLEVETGIWSSGYMIRTVPGMRIYV